MTETSATRAEPAASHPPLTIAEWAAVFAHACHYPPDQLGDALLHLDVAGAEWDEANRRWPAALVQALVAEDSAIGDAFNAAFLSVKRRLKEERPETAALAPLRPPPARPAPALAPVAAVEIAPAVLVAPAVIAPPAAIEAPAIFTLPAAIVPPVVVHAFDHEAPLRAADPRLPTRAELAALVPVEMRGFKDLGGTVQAADVAPRSVLPFQAPRPGDAPPASQRAREPHHEDPRAAVREGMRGVKDLSGTQTAQSAPPGLALPFAPAKAPPPAPPPPPASAPPPPLGGPPRAGDFPVLSVEQYASLCVELELAPARAAETLARYRVAPGLRAALDTHWRERMAQPEVWNAWSSAYARFKAWLLQQPKP